MTARAAVGTNPTTVGSDRDTNQWFHRYPNGLYQAVGQPFYIPIGDPGLFDVYENDFHHYLTTMNGLTETNGDGGSAAVRAAEQTGVLRLTPGGADNDEVYVGSTVATWTLTAGKRLWFDCRVKITEAATTKANCVIGLCDAYGANTLQDSGAGMAASYDGIVFNKIDGGTTWRLNTSVTTTPTLLTAVATRVSGTYMRLSFFYDGATTPTVTPYVNGVAGTGTALTMPAAAMGLLMGCKNGGTGDDLFDVDYVRIVAER